MGYSSTDDDVYHPCLGEFCCAQFSEDECWYRAKVLEIFAGQDESLLGLVTNLEMLISCPTYYLTF